jgi:ABC-type uncharacterized transport system involved in gliding motility auxiliary subunit
VTRTKASSKIKSDLAELQAKYAALENEIRLVRDLRAQVAIKLKKQVQLQMKQSRLFSGTRLRKRAR